MNLASQITLELLATWLKDAAHDVEQTDDNHLYVGSEGVDFPFWVRFGAESDLLILKTYIATKSNADVEQIAKVCNTCNDKLMIPNFHYYHDDNNLIRVYGTYAMSCSGGLDRVQFLKIARRFASEFVFGLRTYDPDDVTGGDRDQPNDQEKISH